MGLPCLLWMVSAWQANKGWWKTRSNSLGLEEYQCCVIEENLKTSFYLVRLKFSAAHWQGIKDDFEQRSQCILGDMKAGLHSCAIWWICICQQYTFLKFTLHSLFVFVHGSLCKNTCLFFIDLEWSVFNLSNRARICIALLNLFSGFANVLLKLFVLVHGFVGKEDADDVEFGIHLHCILSPQTSAARTVSPKVRE